MLFSFKRRQWLQEALAAATEDTYVKRMLKHLQTLDKPQDTDDDDDDLTDKEDAFEGLADIVDNLDNANGTRFLPDNLQVWPSLPCKNVLK